MVWTWNNYQGNRGFLEWIAVQGFFCCVGRSPRLQGPVASDLLTPLPLREKKVKNAISVFPDWFISQVSVILWLLWQLPCWDVMSSLPTPLGFLFLCSEMLPPFPMFVPLSPHPISPPVQCKEEEFPGCCLLRISVHPLCRRSGWMFSRDFSISAFTIFSVHGEAPL